MTSVDPGITGVEAVSCAAPAAISGAYQIGVETLSLIEATPVIETPAARGERVGLRLGVDHRGRASLRLGGGPVRDVEADAVDRRRAGDHRVIEHVGDLRSGRGR